MPLSEKAPYYNQPIFLQYSTSHCWNGGTTAAADNDRPNSQTKVFNMPLIFVPTNMARVPIEIMAPKPKSKYASKSMSYVTYNKVHDKANVISYV